jgi:cytochrome c-type biogenesis protein CcmH/NrfG
LGQRRDAVHAFARVLRFDPDHVGALFHEGLLFAEQRRYRDAVTRWEKVIELGGSTAYGRRARREIRTATDLQRILSERRPA